MTCAYCGFTTTHDPLGAPVTDQETWDAIRAEHSRLCPWAGSLGFQAPGFAQRLIARSKGE